MTTEAEAIHAAQAFFAEPDIELHHQHAREGDNFRERAMREMDANQLAAFLGANSEPDAPPPVTSGQAGQPANSGAAAVTSDTVPGSPPQDPFELIAWLKADRQQLLDAKAGDRKALRQAGDRLAKMREYLGNLPRKIRSINGEGFGDPAMDELAEEIEDVLFMGKDQANAG